MKRFTIIISFIMLTFMPLMAQVKQTVAVLGDSYSTFEGFIPKGYATWYSPTAPPETTDVNKVEQTWWWQVIKEGGYKMGNINSYSGATICNTGYRDEDYTDRSFITRMQALGCPDIIFIFGATNDYWAKSPLGEYQYADWSKKDLYSFRPAMAYMLDTMIDYYPNVEIYFLLNDGLGNEITESVRTICKHYQIDCIELKGLDKMSGHPSVKGMKQISEQVKAYMAVHGK